MIRTLTLLLLSCIFGVSCTPFHQQWKPPAKKCQVWVKIDNGPWHCYERGEVLRALSRE